MTHSLHRIGTEENLLNDYVLLITPAMGINQTNSRLKMLSVLDILTEIQPNNIGSYEIGTIYSGVTIEDIKENMPETPRVRCCFDNKEKMFDLLRHLKELDLGLSVVISGLNTEVVEMAKALDIEPHSVNYSLGIFGKTERLSDNAVLEIMTMCGHGMISSNLIQKMIDQVQSGEKTPEEAAEELAKPCVCGIFNVHRATELLSKYTKSNLIES